MHSFQRVGHFCLLICAALAFSPAVLAQKADQGNADTDGLVLDWASSRQGQVPGQTVTLGHTPYQWELRTSQGTQTLFIRDRNTGDEIAEELGCFMCEGDDDNCNQDGIFVLTQPGIKDTTAFLLVCHQGAHSQRARLISPAQQSTPVIDVTGAYFVDWELVDGTLLITHDGEAPNSIIWPLP
ncbi:hypothetical protein [Thalassospira povalilytica]|uniref:hypothetical protein n=1 Tax=Thalassospira povalilytica TaxID=732237 RepID=UPI001D185D86|nr:hypothetical protein [Thalassospira povalilytica]MCC4242683.1 hypothetical protein [Thalassospira povalilytica]